MALASDVPITKQSIERFRVRARELRAEAELTSQTDSTAASVGNRFSIRAHGRAWPAISGFLVGD